MGKQPVNYLFFLGFRSGGHCFVFLVFHAQGLLEERKLTNHYLLLSSPCVGLSVKGSTGHGEHWWNLQQYSTRSTYNTRCIWGLLDAFGMPLTIMAPVRIQQGQHAPMWRLSCTTFWWEQAIRCLFMKKKFAQGSQNFYPGLTQFSNLV